MGIESAAKAFVDIVYESGYKAGLEAAQPKWISVEERLPELPDGARFASVGVIAYPKGWDRSVFMEYERITLKMGRMVERWLWFGKIFKDEVTHWMPLPEPPKEET